MRVGPLKIWRAVVSERRSAEPGSGCTTAGSRAPAGCVYPGGSCAPAATAAFGHPFCRPPAAPTDRCDPVPTAPRPAVAAAPGRCSGRLTVNACRARLRLPGEPAFPLHGAQQERTWRRETLSTSARSCRVVSVVSPWQRCLRRMNCCCNLDVDIKRNAPPQLVNFSFPILRR